MKLSEINKVLSFIEDKVIYPDISTIEGASTNPEITVNGEKVLIFCSNNYLSLATDPRIKEEMKKAVERYGLGSGGSRLVSGNTEIQGELERKIAQFKGTEDAITFSTGYMANTGVIPALLDPLAHSFVSYLKGKTFLRDTSVVFSDELNHASIVDGIRLSRAEKIIYKHRDLDDLERLLKKASGYSRKLIITDGVFSMDGDITPLGGIMGLGKKYDVVVMVDDAHATGVLGESGRGTAQHFHLQTPPDITMGTFTKVFGGVGGFIAGTKELIKYLRVTARTYIFSAPIPPVIAAGLIKSIDIVSSEPQRRERLWGNVSYLHEQLAKHDFDTLESQTQIIPIVIGDEKKAITVSRRLLEKGYFIPCIRWPAVAHGASRLRLTLMADHTKEHMDGLVKALVSIKEELRF